MKPIRGLMLVRNEDFLAPWALMNALPACDEFLVLDNGSDDRTREGLEAAARAEARIRIVTVPDAYDTHRFVEPWAREDVWVLNVDGDELYDPAGLAAMRPRLQAGAFDDWWRLSFRTVHAWTLDLDAGRARGFDSPPNRRLPKLFNFGAIEAWDQGRHERLHGKDMVFRPGHRLDGIMPEDPDWDRGLLRCLHLCFMPRSSAAPEQGDAPNPSELRKAARPLRRLRDMALGLFGVAPAPRPSYKQRHYGQGPLIEVDVSAFSRPSACPWHPCADQAEAAFAAASAARIAAGRATS
ncbi:MAG: hypothetical protein ACK4WC_10850 [Rubrimonas sp.]